MLNVDDAVPWLAGLGLIDLGWIIDGELTIASAARRNRNLRVEGPNRAGYLVKQPDRQEKWSHQTLTSEAAFYRFCQEVPVAAEMLKIAPRLVYFEPEEAILALELLPDAEPLWTYYQAQGDHGFPVDACAALGFAFGKIHRVFREEVILRNPQLDWLGDSIPWVLEIHKPDLVLLESLSSANLQTIRILQSQQGMAERLARLRERWRSESVIHGDVKYENMLAWRSQDGKTEVRIVDWEMVQLGDAAWDLGGLLQDFIDFWVSSMPLLEDMSMTNRVAQARYALTVIQGAIRSFWSAYRSASDLPPNEAEERLQRAVEFSAARMIQTAYELSFQLPALSPRSVMLLQISANLLADPERGRFELYGIPLALRR